MNDADEVESLIERIRCFPPSLMLRSYVIQLGEARDARAIELLIELLNTNVGEIATRALA